MGTDTAREELTHEPGVDLGGDLRERLKDALAQVGARWRRRGRALLPHAVGVRATCRRAAVIMIVVVLLLAAAANPISNGSVDGVPGTDASRIVASAVALLAVLGWVLRRGRGVMLLLMVFVSIAYVGGAVLTWPAAMGLMYLAVAEDRQQVPWRGWVAGAAGVVAAVTVLDIDGLAAVLALLGGGLVAVLIRSLEHGAVLSREASVLRAEASASQAQVRWLEQRSALARELHDVVGHHVTAMVVHAEAGQVELAHLLRCPGHDVGDGAGHDVGGGTAAGPENVLRTLQTIADGGRTALGELDVLVGRLRDPQDRPVLTAPPRLADVDAVLAEPLRRAGTDVHVQLDGQDVEELDEVVALTAYRIVQEALTNITRHAAARTAWVEVGVQGPHLRLRVSDDGVGLAAGPVDAPRRGAGLLGITERVEALHGIVSVTVRPGGGTVVDAFLPHTLSTSETQKTREMW